MMQKKKKLTKIENEIQEYKKYLKSLQTTMSFSSKSVNELGEIIVHVHYTIDYFMNNILAYSITEQHLDISDEPLKYENIFHDIFTLVEHMDYLQKVKAIEEFQALPESRIKQLYYVNNIRREFAHRLSYTDRLERYKKVDNYLQVLKNCFDISDFVIVYASEKTYPIMNLQETSKRRKVKKRS